MTGLASITGNLPKAALCRPTTARRARVCKVRCQSGSNGVNATTPHSGYHFDGTSRRFFEGWYFKVALPGAGNSFALIYSIEDPSGVGAFQGTGVQVMGPEDTYLLQYSKDVKNFWAQKSELALGTCFKPTNARKSGVMPRMPLSEVQFNDFIAQGFQATTNWHQGAVVADETGAAGYLPSNVGSAKWAFAVRPVYGWGDSGSKQKSTAGWLAALPVFEPHWQVMMAHGLATGWFEWGGKRVDFKDAPAYAEKNWGGGFPQKWFWIQCNTFNEDKNVSLTAIGARRGVMQLPGILEDVGMIGIHWQGEFIELVPWQGSVQWEVEPWGKWRVWARTSRYEAVVEATCGSPGTPLRAPTSDAGLAPFCRDTFAGNVRLRLWRLDRFGNKPGTPVLDVTSDSAALEVGGGTWWSTWRAQAKMAEPLRSALNLPLDLDGLASMMPANLRPPGL